MHIGIAPLGMGSKTLDLDYTLRDKRPGTQTIPCLCLQNIVLKKTSVRYISSIDLHAATYINALLRVVVYEI